MVLWRDRPRGYQLGFLGLILSVVVYVVAFSLPYWSFLHLSRINPEGGAPYYADQTIGLWQSCLADAIFTCVSNVQSSNPPWINAARAMCSFALILYAFSMLSGLYRNMSRYGQMNDDTPGKHVECLAIMATLLGFIGCIVFGAEFNRIYVLSYHVGQLYWGFGAACAALSLAGVSSCLMFAFNRTQHLRTRRAHTRRVRGPNGVPVSVHFPADLGEDCVHIPYYGDISNGEMVYGAGPMQPPSYETVTGAGSGQGQAPAYETVNENGRGDNGARDSEGYSAPPVDTADAPPLYDEVAKDLSSLPPEVVAHLQMNNKDEEPQLPPPDYSHPPPQ